MLPKIKITNTLVPDLSCIRILRNPSHIRTLSKIQLHDEEVKTIISQFIDEHKTLILVNRLYKVLGFFHPEGYKNDPNLTLEACRKAGEQTVAKINSLNIKELNIIIEDKMAVFALAFLEGMLLGNYQFIKYRSDKNDKKNSLQKINLSGAGISETDIKSLLIIAGSVFFCRDLVNEPQCWLSAQKLAEEISRTAIKAGVKVEIFNRSKIASLKMNGLLTVNKGSASPPTFTTLEWKPRNAVNTKPLIYIGKGVVFDTGGINLKSSAGLEGMKSDMSGAAAVASAISAIAALKLPVHIIGLIPATDNRPSGNACVPGDIIEMMNGTTVEVLNTDAEGRLILADAICYAELMDPELIVTIATLTGAAHAAIGKYGIVAMGTVSEQTFLQFKKCGNSVHERLAEFPFWSDYDELIKSDVADIKNIGGPYGGAITAGKFLARFTKRPFLHLDIAGPAFTDKKDSYRGQGGTGAGVRLLIAYAKLLANGQRSDPK